MTRRRWTVDGMGVDVRIELLDFPSHDAPDRQTWRRELDTLLSRSYDPRVRRVLEEIFEASQGRAAPRPGDRKQGPSFESGLASDLRFAAYSGQLKVERVERPRIVPPVEADAAEVLGPASDREPAPKSKSWVGMVLVDQDGVPVPGRPYRLIQPDGTTVDGTLDSNGSAIVNGIDPGNCQIWCPYVAPHPQVAYEVQQGDQASGVAETYGFDDYTTVWNDPGNASLQSQRTDPHVLVPGDALTIPEIKEAPAANKPTGAKHNFTIKRTPLKLRVKVLDLKAKPLTSAPVTVDGAPLTTDGSGLVEAPVDKTTRSVSLEDATTTFALDVGAINPPDDATAAGYRARLFNLGFLWDPNVADADDEMIIALEDFQAEYSLTISGQLDDATKGQLTQTYGS